MSSPHVPLDPDDLLDLPLPDDVQGYELVNGKLYPVTPASQKHGRLIIEVGYHLRRYVEATGLGGEVYADSGFVLGLKRDPKRMRGPDVAYVSRDRLLQNPDSDPEKFARYAADLAVEIELSSGRKPHARQRIRDYIEAGVPLVWSIESRKRRATVYRQDGSVTILGEDGVLDGEAVLPGFRLPLAQLFD